MRNFERIILFAMAAMISLCLFSCGRADRTDETTIGGSGSSDDMNDIKLPTLDEGDDADQLPEHGYLADAIFDTDEYMPEYDSPTSYVGDFTYRQLYEYGDNIYTYTATGDHDGFITVTDKQTHTSMPLCTVDGCPHTGEGCEAYINGAVYGFRVYDGALMWVQGLFDTTSTVSLVKCGLDGGERETVWSYGMTNNELGFNFADFFARAYGSFEVTIHRGYIYFSGVSQTGSMVACMPLCGGKPVTLANSSALGAVDQSYAVSCRVRFIKNDLYVMMNRLEKRPRVDGTSSVDEYDRVIFYKIDTRTRNVETVGETECLMEQGKLYTYDENAFCVVPDDGIYFIKLYEYYPNEDSHDAFDSTATICKIPFDGSIVEEKSKLADGDFDSFFHVSMTSLTNDRCVVEAHSMGNMYVFDLDGKLISKREFLTEYDHPRVDVIGAGADSIYFSCEADGKRFFTDASADGGAAAVFSEYALYEQQYEEIDSSASTMSGKTVELTVPSGSDDPDVTVTYSANAVNVTDYVIVEAHADGIENLHGLPPIYATYCGSAYVRTPHGYEETLDEIRNSGDTTLDKLPHIMYNSGRYAEFSFYFLDERVAGVRRCKTYAGIDAVNTFSETETYGEN